MLPGADAGVFMNSHKIVIEASSKCIWGCRTIATWATRALPFFIINCGQVQQWCCSHKTSLNNKLRLVYCGRTGWYRCLARRQGLRIVILKDVNFFFRFGSMLTCIIIVGRSTPYNSRWWRIDHLSHTANAIIPMPSHRPILICIVHQQIHREGTNTFHLLSPWQIFLLPSSFKEGLLSWNIRSSPTLRYYRRWWWSQ